MATQTLLSLPSTTYAAGIFTSTSFSVPANATQLTTTFNINSTDLAKAVNIIQFEVDRLVNATFVFDHGFTWKGGLAIQPIIQVDIGPLAGQTIQLVLNFNNSMTTAITVTSS